VALALGHNDSQKGDIVLYIMLLPQPGNKKNTTII